MSQTLLPGAVTVRDENGGLPQFPASGVTGSPPQWADNNDATYATTGIGFPPGATSANDYAFATLPQLTLTPAVVRDVVTTARVAAFPHPDSLSATFQVVLPATASGLLSGLIAFADVALDGVIRDVRFSLREVATAGGLDPEVIDAIILELATALAEGPSSVRSIVVGTYSPNVLVSRIYELAVQAIAVDEAQVVQTSLHPVRRYPRDDGQAMSSAPRLYPPPRADRVFAGHQ